MKDGRKGGREGGKEGGKDFSSQKTRKGEVLKTENVQPITHRKGMTPSSFTPIKAKWEAQLSTPARL